MAEYTHEGSKVFLVPTIASATLVPTAVEVNAGTDLSPFVAVDGIARNPTQNVASQPLLGDSFISTAVGTWGMGLTLTMVRHAVTADDDAFTAFSYGDESNIVIFPSGTAGATPAIGDRAEVFKVDVHEPIGLPSAENEFVKFQVMFGVKQYASDVTLT